MKFKVYIPARYASSRLPGKPLLLVGGKPILQHVYENARSSGAEEVVIATDDDRIAESAAGYGAIVVRTQSTHRSGTDRIAEAVTSRREHEDAVIVNVQGDEPELPATVIQQVANLIGSNTAIDIASVCEPILDERELRDPNCVKVVRAVDDRALYFSRARIPHARELGDVDLTHYRRHVGIYAYRVGYLRQFVASPAGALEKVERLEQLRALGLNATIVVADAIAGCGVGVDTREDYDRLIERWQLAG